MKKRPHLLIELMIAMALIILCIVPLVKGPIELIQDEVRASHSAAAQREIRCLYGEIVAQLHQGKIPIPTKNPTVLIDDERKSCLLWLHKEKKGEVGESFCLLKLQITIKKPIQQVATYDLFATITSQEKVEEKI